MLDNIFNRKTDDPEQDVTAEVEEQDQVEQADSQILEAEAAEDQELPEVKPDLPEEEVQEFVLVSEDEEAPASDWSEEADAEPLETEAALMEAPAFSSSQLSFDEKVIEKIVGVAVRDIPGVLLADGGGGFFNLKTNKGVDINVDDQDQVSLDLNVVLEYGKSAPDIYDQLKITLHDRIFKMTGLSLKNINVHVVNILTSEEFAEKQ